MKTQKQFQHIVPRVYLKEFGFRRENKQWVVSVLEKWNPQLKTKSIESFLGANNHFDIPVSNHDFRFINEKLVNKAFEDKYSKLLAELKLETPHNDLLIQIIEFSVNILCRTNFLRETLDKILRSDGNENMIELITCLMEKDKQALVRNKLKKIPKPHHINFLLVFIMDYIIGIMKNCSFTVSILKAPENKDWITSDNPAMLIDAFHEEFFDFNTEIIFPFSKQYLVYIYNQQKENRFLQVNKPFSEIIHVSEADLLKITEYVYQYETKHIIFPCDMGQVRLDQL